LRVSALKNWINTSFAKSYLKKGLEALKSVCISFLYKNGQSSQEESCETPSTAASADNFSAAKFFNYEHEVDGEKNKDSIVFKRDKETEIEITHFSGLLGDSRVIKKTKSTLEFWKEHRLKMPNLFNLQIILLNISSSSSFIERFFSISGIVCEIRRCNMNDDLVVMRSMMKANMPILNDLNEISE
jgi:hypothetical protein